MIQFWLSYIAHGLIFVVKKSNHFWVCPGHVSVFLASKGNNFASVVVCSRCSSENNNKKLEEVKKRLMRNKLFYLTSLLWKHNSNSNKHFISEKRCPQPHRRKEHNWLHSVTEARDTILSVVAAFINTFSFFSPHYLLCIMKLEWGKQEEVSTIWGAYRVHICPLSLWGSLHFLPFFSPKLHLPFNSSVSIALFMGAYYICRKVTIDNPVSGLGGQKGKFLMCSLVKLVKTFQSQSITSLFSSHLSSSRSFCLWSGCSKGGLPSEYAEVALHVFSCLKCIQRISWIS